VKLLSEIPIQTFFSRILALLRSESSSDRSRSGPQWFSDGRLPLVRSISKRSLPWFSFLRASGARILSRQSDAKPARIAPTAIIRLALFNGNCRHPIPEIMHDATRKPVQAGLASLTLSGLGDLTDSEIYTPPKAPLGCTAPKRDARALRG